MSLQKEHEFLIDSREGSRIFQHARIQGLKFTKYALNSGDFALRDRESKKLLVGMERKNVPDLFNSIQSRRIFDQAKRMRDQYPIRYLLIVGNLDDSVNQFESIGLKVDINVIEGTLASLNVRYGLNIIWVPTEAMAVSLAHRVIVKISEGKYDLVNNRSKRINSPIDMLMMISGVTRIKAKDMMKEFKNIKGICLASEEHLKNIKGVGPTLAKNIKHFLCVKGGK